MYDDNCVAFGVRGPTASSVIIEMELGSLRVL